MCDEAGIQERILQDHGLIELSIVFLRRSKSKNWAKERRWIGKLQCMMGEHVASREDFQRHIFRVGITY